MGGQKVGWAWIERSEGGGGGGGGGCGGGGGGGAASCFDGILQVVHVSCVGGDCSPPVTRMWPQVCLQDEQIAGI